MYYCFGVCLVGPVITMHDIDSSAVTVALHSCGQRREREWETQTAEEVIYSAKQLESRGERKRTFCWNPKNGESREV